MLPMLRLRNSEEPVISLPHREMSEAGDAPAEKYLLNTVQLNIDGRNWFQAIDLKEI